MGGQRSVVARVCFTMDGLGRGGTGERGCARVCHSRTKWRVIEVFLILFSRRVARARRNAHIPQLQHQNSATPAKVQNREVWTSHNRGRRRSRHGVKARSVTHTQDKNPRPGRDPPRNARRSMRRRRSAGASCNTRPCSSAPSPVCTASRLRSSPHPANLGNSSPRSACVPATRRWGSRCRR